MRELTKADSDTELEIEIGDTLELRLPENRTTGYRWQMCSAGAPALQLIEDSFTPPSGALGAGGMRRWKFRAALAGAARLEPEHHRSWSAGQLKRSMRRPA
jgi:inhibitor of cysteine peptidase